MEMTFNFSGTDFKVKPFFNTGFLCYQVIDITTNKELYAFTQEDLNNLEDFKEDLIFTIIKVVDRTSIFNRKHQCLEFAELLIATTEVLKEVIEIQDSTGCKNVFVDTTYKEAKLFPIYNETQKEFVKLILGGKWSRFDDILVNVLNSKSSDFNELREDYFNKIDFLD